MKQKILLSIFTCVFAILFFSFSVGVKKGKFTQLDFDTTVRFQDHTPVRLDKLFPIFGTLASLPAMTIILSIGILIYKKWRGIAVIILFLAAHSVELFGKLYIHHPPPPFLFYKHLDAAQFAIGKYYTNTGSSYPSGHEFRIMFVGIVLAFILSYKLKKHKLVKILLYCLIPCLVLIVGISRISLGEHWTSDVIGGGLFGIAAGTLGLLFL